MNCKYCGTELPEGATFCTECGKKTGNTSIRLSCSECGAPLRQDGKSKTLVCPYCGSRRILKENDSLIRSQLRAKRARDRLRDQQKQEEKRKQQAENAERERQRNEEKQQQRVILLERNQRKKQSSAIQREKRKKRREDYKHSISIVLCFTGLFVCLVGLLVSLYSDEYTAALVAGVQIALLILSFLLGMQYIPTKHDNMWLIPRLLCFVLSLAFIVAYEGDFKLPHYDPWPKDGIAACLPELEEKGTQCKVKTNSNKEIEIRLEGIEAATVLKYIEQCKDAGFILDPFDREDSYKAFNDEGYSVKITNYGSSKLMNINLKAPMEMSSFSWPHYTPYDMVPTPEFSKARILYEYANILHIVVNDNDRQAFNTYVNRCIDSGYDIEYRRNEDDFHGTNEAGVSLGVTYLGMGQMEIDMYRPREDQK